MKYPGGRRGGVAGVVASCLRAYCGAVQTLNHWIRGVDQVSAALRFKGAVMLSLQPLYTAILYQH